MRCHPPPPSPLPSVCIYELKEKKLILLQHVEQFQVQLFYNEMQKCVDSRLLKKIEIVFDSN
jgi:hypothetical protein